MVMDQLRVEDNERVDIQDFEFLQETVETHQRQVFTDFACDPAKGQKWVLDGFAMSNPIGTQLAVAAGRAILAYRTGEGVRYGVLVSESDAGLTVDLNTYPLGTYGIYVRFELVPAESQGRVFWNPAGYEYGRAIHTRYAAQWSVRVELTSPGDEWLKIGEVVRASMTITDQRDFFFEGAVSGSYASGWSTDGGGIANDRNAARATHGVHDLQTFTAAVRQCLTDIRGRGLRAWYARDIGGMNLGFDADPVEDRLALGDAAFYLDGSTQDWGFDTGDLLGYDRPTNVLSLTIGTAEQMQFSTTGILPINHALTLGTDTYPWTTVYSDSVSLKGAAGQGVLTGWFPATANANDLGNATYPWKDAYLNSIYLNSAAPFIKILDSDRAANNQKTWIWTNGLTLDISAVSDDEATKNPYLRFTRSDADVAEIGVGASLVPISGYSVNVGSETYPIGEVVSDQFYLVAGSGHGVLTSWFPGTTQVSDLGTDVKAWKDAYLSGTLHIDHATNQDMNLFMGSGSTDDDRNWAIVTNTTWSLACRDRNWANAVDVISITRTGTTPGTMTVTPDLEIANTKIIKPAGDLNATLGLLGKRWQWVFAAGIDSGAEAMHLHSDTGVTVDHDLIVSGALQVNTMARVGGACGDGIAGYLTLGDGTTSGSGGNGSIGPSGGYTNTGWLVWRLETTLIYIPYWTHVDPV